MLHRVLNTTLLSNCYYYRSRHKKWSFPLNATRFSADLVKFTKKLLNGKLIFFTQWLAWPSPISGSPHWYNEILNWMVIELTTVKLLQDANFAMFTSTWTFYLYQSLTDTYSFLHYEKYFSYRLDRILVAFI